MTVSKKYNGKDSGPFTFGVSVKLPNGTVKALSDITVAKNGSTDITGIPKGSEVTVTEKTTGYNVSYKIGTGSSTNGNTATITNLTADTETFSYYIPSNYEKCTTYYYDTSCNDTGTGNFFCQVGSPEYNAYLTFMGGDEQVVKVKTDVKNGRKLMIVKDSYGNALPGYLFGSFEEIYVVDMRYFNNNLVQYIKDEGVTDLLFAGTDFRIKLVKLED